ncbi:NUDIX hydrolase [Leptolyngbya sp. FACHB-36]|uniref:NUDIX domain-containing protein n=1 Tax=Leptolyngbya sp. FACHB-36 TaxID=2692808 RepID=UPI001F54EF20|nr:NUDIX hydrolase [Leptolyngbya sp. FACHB-36]
MTDVPHFQESGRVNPTHPDDRLPEDVYTRSLDYLVFACVDLVFTAGSQMLLAKRKTLPRASWWIVGGRMAAGESPKEAARRKAAKEARLEGLSDDRFRYVGVYSTCFATRQQPPQQHGSHSLNLTFQVELTVEEQQRMTLRSDEYDTWQWVERSEVSALLNANDGLDEALLQVIGDLAPV